MSIIKVGIDNTIGFSPFSPPSGFRWKLLSAYLLLTTGTSTGTRRVNIYTSPLTMFISSVFLDTLDQTGTSTTFSSSTNSLSGGGSSNTLVKYSEKIISEFEEISSYASLQSGDVFSLLLVLEESDA